jgi:hypothetical protein
MCLELMRKKRRQGMLRFRAVRMQIVKVCVCVCVCVSVIEPAESIYSFLE